jgi:ATP-dependent protease ClpP protease subunit
MVNNYKFQENLSLLHEYNVITNKREIFLHSYIDGEEDGGVDYRSSVILQKNIRHLTLGSHDPILIHMNMPGGDWEDCLSMFDTIKLCPATTSILGYGKIQSSSGVIFQSSNLRIMMPNATLLIHYGYVSINDEHSKAASTSIKWYEKQTDNMINIFVEKCLNSSFAKDKKWKKNPHFIRKHITSQISNKYDWLLDAEEAVYYGFADGILGSKEYPDVESIKSHAARIH